MDMAEIRKQFPVTERLAFMNHAAVAPIPACTRDAMVETLREICSTGDLYSRTWSEKIEKARGLAAQLIGASASEIAFVKNTTEGILCVANGIDWREGDNVVLPDHEFPANVYPWLNLGRLGVEARRVPPIEGRVPVEEIESRMDARTRCVAISFVQFASGFRADLESLGNICERRGILLCVDAIQGLGAFDLNVQDCKIHFLSADGHKWLLSPEGAGIFYCAAEVLDRLRLSAMGWMSVANRSDYLDYDMTLAPDARRFECGSYNTVGIIGLRTTLEYLLSIGIAAIEQRIIGLTDRLCEGLEERGYSVFSSRRPGEKSGIVCFSHGSHSSGELVKRLRRNKIITSVRSGRVRVSPHFYNSEEEIDRLLALLL